MKALQTSVLLFAAITVSQAQLISPTFISPDTICVNQSLNITNNTTGPASSYFWNFCSGSPAPATQTAMLSGTSYPISLPVYMDVVKDGANYHMFVTNNGAGTVTRLDYGTSLTNTPTHTNLGFVVSNIEDIHVEKEGANWYGIAVGGLGNSAVVRLNFGTSIVNTPTVVNMGNIGNLNYPHTLVMFRSGGNCFGLTINQSGNTITKLSFGNSIANVPTGVNFGNIGGLNSPSQMALISHNGNWHAFICNDGSVKSLTRLDFGNNLLSTPTATNLGNLGGQIGQPRGLNLWSECGNIKGLLADNATGTLKNINFPAGPTGTVALSTASIQSTLSYPQTIYRMRHNNDLLFYIVNVMSNSLTRITVNPCAAAPASSLQTPVPVTFSATGDYIISMSAEDGGYNNVQACRKITVVDSPTLNVTPSQTICDGKSAILTASGTISYSWSTGAKTSTINVAPSVTTVYTVTGNNNTACQAKATVTVNVSNCVGITEKSQGPVLNVYPNPTTGELAIGTDVKLLVKIYDLAGHLVAEHVLEAYGKTILSLEHLEPGLYTLEAIGAKGISHVKIIRE